MKSMDMVSCIVPTYNRHNLLEQSMHMFVRQTYPVCELIIIDDSPRVPRRFRSVLQELTRKHPDRPITYIRLRERCSIGHKRNMAIREANGRYIAFWDDDDIHGPNRLWNQVRRIRRTRSDVTANGTHFYHDTTRKTTYRLKEFEHLQAQLWWRRILMPSILFKKSLWKERMQFPDISVSEDREFFRRVLRAHPDLRIDLWKEAPMGDFVYVIHERNTAWSDVASQMISVTKPYFKHFR